MPRAEDKKNKKNEPKNSAPTKRTRINTKARQHRHEARIAAAHAARVAGRRGGHRRQKTINDKAATRRRMASYTPEVRAEHRAAGIEHRKPRIRR